MARRAITTDFYESLVDTFREMPGNAHGVCRRVANDPRSGGSCNRRTAQRAWSQGWPERGLPPVREVIASEQREAREALAQESPEALLSEIVPRAVERAKERQDAVDARVSSAIVLQEARQNVIQILQGTGAMLDAYGCVASNVLEFSRSDEPSPKEMCHVLHILSKTVREAVQAGARVLEMERLLLGEP